MHDSATKNAVITSVGDYNDMVFNAEKYTLGCREITATHTDCRHGINIALYDG